MLLDLVKILAKKCEKLCKENSDLNEKYGWLSNMGYGTKLHMAGIQKHGVSKYHRKSFGICRDYCNKKYK